MVERCLGQLIILIMIACNVPLVALFHAIALAFTFFFMTSPSMESSAFKIRKAIVKAVPFQKRKQIEWTFQMESQPP